MKPIASPSRRRAAAHQGLRALALALVATALLPAMTARAENAPHETVACSRAAAATPPDYPDAKHVPNGCYLSTTAYIAKFSAEFPCEQAVPLAVLMVNADGQKRPHTITLLTWQGRWWGRDEYFGVFALNRAVGSAGVTNAIGLEAERMLERQAARCMEGAGHRRATAPREMAPELRAKEITTAASMLPFATEQFWVRSGNHEIPFLFFHPASGKIAVYDPLSGTATADCVMTDGAEVVALVAAQLGYKADSVARHPATATPAGYASAR